MFLTVNYWLNSPSDIAYVFSGYAPLSIRLVQWALRGEWCVILIHQ